VEGICGLPHRHEKDVVLRYLRDIETRDTNEEFQQDGTNIRTEVGYLAYVLDCIINDDFDGAVAFVQLLNEKIGREIFHRLARVIKERELSQMSEHLILAFYIIL
jgi:hypothetical protein